MMNKNETDTLNEAIEVLRLKRAYELQLVKEQMHTAYQSLRPINLIKSTFREVSSSTTIKNNILNNVIGLGTGYISKKILLGSSRNPIKRLLGTVIEFAIANVVSKHTAGIKAKGENILHRFLNYRMHAKSDFHHNGNV